MKKTLKVFALILFISLLGCNKNKEEVEPKVNKSANVSNDNNNNGGNDTVTSPPIINPPSYSPNIADSSNYFFLSVLDDSLVYTADSVKNIFGALYLYDDFQNPRIKIRIDTSYYGRDTNLVVGSYMNEYLVSNVEDYGLNLIHGYYPNNAANAAGVTLGSSSTQINRLEITKIENDRVWIVYDVDYHYTHWQNTHWNKSGNIKAYINGFKFR